MSESAPDSFIAFRQVSKAFGSLEVLKQMDLDVREGETIVILGASGSGKSVILRHIIGLLLPDEGQVWVDGEDVTELDERGLRQVRRKVGMLFQAGALFDSMTVGENVAFPLHERSEEWPEVRIRERVEEVLGLVNLPDIQEKMPSALSGGMRKRVALARAIAVKPRAILYDEPTTGLDPLTTVTINDLIRDLAARLGVTSVVVTHDIGSAFYVCDRIAFLHEGRMRFVGTPEEAERTGDKRLQEFLEASRIGGGA